MKAGLCIKRKCVSWCCTCGVCNCRNINSLKHFSLLLFRWSDSFPQLPAVWVQWWEHRVLDGLWGLQEDQEPSENGSQGQEDLWGFHPVWGTQRGQILLSFSLLFKSIPLTVFVHSWVDTLPKGMPKQTALKGSICVMLEWTVKPSDVDNIGSFQRRTPVPKKMSSNQKKEEKLLLSPIL